MATLPAEPQSQPPPQTKPDSVPRTPPTPPPPHNHTTGQQQQQQPQNQTIAAAATAAPSGSHQHHHRHPDAAAFSCYPSSSSPDVSPPPPPPAAKTVLELEAANVAHFDALGHNFDEHHPDAAGFADRLSRALRRVLVLDEDATSVLDYACGSGKQTFFVSAATLLDSFFC